MAKRITTQTIRFHYTCRELDGTVLESTRDGKPDSIVLGKGELAPVLEETLAAMLPGESRTVRLTPETGYGYPDPDLLYEVPLSSLELEEPPEIGMVVALFDPNGAPFPATIVEINDDTLLVDANHPFAGKTLLYDLQRV